jgi:hypothetical protein
MHSSALPISRASELEAANKTRDDGKMLNRNRLHTSVISITSLGRFGSANASSTCTKEAADSFMTFTLFDKERHFTKSRSGWRNGIPNCLS